MTTRTAAVEDVLRGLRSAYAATSVRREAPPAYARAFATLLDDELAERLTRTEILVMLDYAERREAGLAAARAGALDEAEAHLAAARRTVADAGLSEATSLLATALLEPAQAYLEYRRGRHETARELLWHAALLDRTLVRVHGFACMRAHRLQLAHNLVRIHRRLGEDEAAIGLVAEVLSRTESSESLRVVPEDVVSFYVDALVGEVAPLYAGRTGDAVAASFEPLRGHAACGSTLGRRAHGWLELKALALDGDVVGALDAAAGVIADGRGETPSLWHAAVQDAAALCAALGAASLSDGAADR